MTEKVKVNWRVPPAPRRFYGDDPGDRLEETDTEVPEVQITTDMGTLEADDET